jgi:hypothetical protein
VLTFKQYITEEELQKKLIIIGQGAPYNQIVFLAGGAGSGKAFATEEVEKGVWDLQIT